MLARSSSSVSSSPAARPDPITSDPSEMGSSSKRSSSRRGERDSRRDRDRDRDYDRGSSHRDRDHDRDRRSQSSRRDRQKSRSRAKNDDDDKDDHSDEGTDPELSEYDDDDYGSRSRRSRRSGGVPYPEDDTPFTDSGYARSTDNPRKSRPSVGKDDAAGGFDPPLQSGYGSSANQQPRQDPYGEPNRTETYLKPIIY